MTKTNDIDSNTAKIASELATTTANTAVALASKTAESMAVIGTDIGWMKQSLVAIETKLDQMDKAFVTAAQHAEVCSEIADHETRIRKIEDNQGKWMGAIAVITFVVTIAVSFLVKFIH
jgi:hypothetical protein